MTTAVETQPAQPALFDNGTDLGEGSLVVIVRQNHIDRGRRRDPSLCAIALATLECFPNAASVRVDSDGGLNVVSGDGSRRFEAAGAADFVRAFDVDKASVHPERFVFRRIGGSLS